MFWYCSLNRDTDTEYYISILFDGAYLFAFTVNIVNAALYIWINEIYHNIHVGGQW